MRIKIIYILFLFLAFLWQETNAQDIKSRRVLKVNPTKKDTTFPQKKDTLSTIAKESLLAKKTDTVAKDSIQKPKEVLEHVVTHNADDYTIQNAKSKTVTLYNKAHVTYGDIDLKAGKIIVDYKKNTVYATGIKDSTGYQQRPVFKQGNQETEQDSILFNFKSKKALVYGIKTVQGEMITYGNVSKRVNDSTIYMRKLRFTTSEKEIPDYYIATDKAKLVPGKKIIVGGSQLVLADVPTPLYLPFAYFPLTEKRTSGFIIPSWGENNNQGFFLQNGGYYFAINDYVDLTLLADLYTNGSWGARAESSYRVRYKFSGGFNFSYQNHIQGIRGLSDYSKSSNYNIRWNHSQDTKSSPNSRLSASVNLGSSRYFRESINEIDQNQFLNNTLQSSINYYQKFVGTPFNMNVSMRHSQNSNTQEIDMTLPSLTLNMDRINPFEGKGGIRKTPIQKIGVNYNMVGEYKINTTDEDFFTSKMFNDARAGIQHNLSASTNIKAFKYFTLTPSANYKDVWYFDKILKRYDPTITNASGNLGTVVNDTINGFNRFNDYSISASLSTVLYGQFNFKKGTLKALRHTMTPSINWGYRPDFATQHQLQVQQSANPNNFETYTPFEGGLYGAPASGVSNSIGITLNNVLEAKVANKDPDSDEEDKKVTIFNAFNFSTNYNMAADSLRWSNVNYNIATRLFKDKMNVNLTGSLDPYQVTKEGVRINKFNSSIFRIASASLTANYSISSNDFKDEEDKDNKSNTNNAPPDVHGVAINPTNDFASRLPNNNKREVKETKLYKANIPWNVSFIYATSYSNNGYGDAGIKNHTLGFSGNIELTPKWKVGFSSGYDFVGKDFAFTRLNFSRDLDSWRFNFNWVPFGINTSYNFFIGVKSSMLSDLKWEKNKPADRRLF